jgi:hypothetical protein
VFRAFWAAIVNFILTAHREGRGRGRRLVGGDLRNFVVYGALAGARAFMRRSSVES